MQVKNPKAVRIVEKWKREGMQEGMLQIARNMKAAGMDTNTIAKMTGLFVDDILRL